MEKGAPVSMTATNACMYFNQRLIIRNAETAVSCEETLNNPKDEAKIPLT